LIPPDRQTPDTISKQQQQDQEKSLQLLEDRLRGRGTETEEKIQKRMGNARGEMEYGLEDGNMDKILVNEDLDAATDELKALFMEWYPHLVNFQ